MVSKNVVITDVKTALQLKQSLIRQEKYDFLRDYGILFRHKTTCKIIIATIEEKISKLKSIYYELSDKIKRGEIKAEIKRLENIKKMLKELKTRVRNRMGKVEPIVNIIRNNDVNATLNEINEIIKKIEKMKGNFRYRHVLFELIRELDGGEEFNAKTLFRRWETATLEREIEIYETHVGHLVQYKKFDVSSTLRDLFYRLITLISKRKEKIRMVLSYVYDVEKGRGNKDKNFAAIQRELKEMENYNFKGLMFHLIKEINDETVKEKELVGVRK